MIKRIGYVVVALFVFSVCFAGGITDKYKAIIVARGVASGGSATNYLNDANCAGAWYMDGGLSAGVDNETDRCSGGSETLTETSGDIPNSADVTSGFSGYSRAFVQADSEYLLHIDGGTTDISGADQSITIVFRIKNTTIAAAESQGIIAKYLTAGNQRQFAIRILGTATDEYKISAYLSSNGVASAGVDSTTTNYASGDWVFCAVVYNDTDIRIYGSDGTLDCTPQAYTGGIFDSTTNFYVGAWPGVANNFDGLIDGVALFDRALSSTEILGIYNSGIDGAKGAND